MATLLKQLRSNVKHWWQRRTRGWSDDELWNLDVTIAKFTLPRLKAFRSGPAMGGTPTTIATNEEWLAILDEMIFAFEFVAGENYYINQHNKNEYERCEKGLALFAKHFMSLWD